MFNLSEYDQDTELPQIIYINRFDGEADDEGDDLEYEWTARKVILLIIAVILIAGMLFAYFILPLLQTTVLVPSAPPQPITPDFIA